MVLTVCGHCFSEDPDREIDYETDILQGNLVAMDGRVYLRRICRRGHGEVVSLYEEDVRVWEDLQQWRIPTREIMPDRAGNTRPIPMGYLDGLGDLQTQHCCVLLVDVTETCNLECPTCFATSGPGVGRHARSHEVLRTLDAAIDREGGRLDALMLSGGEPTVHPDIVEIIRAAVERNVTRVIINTNGIRIARDDAFLRGARVAARSGRGLSPVRGFRESTYRWHRGEDLRAVKDAAIRRRTDAGSSRPWPWPWPRASTRTRWGRSSTSPSTPTTSAGVAIQPMFTAGRANAIDPMDRATTTGTIAWFPRPAGRSRPTTSSLCPCSHPDCASMTYFVRRDAARSARSSACSGRDRLKENLGFVSNRIAPDDGMWAVLAGMMSETRSSARR